MNMIAVNRTIRELCSEIQASSECVQDWRLHTEQDLLYEACVCIFSSQMVFEVAEAGAKTLRNQGLLLSSNYSGDIEIYENRLIVALSDPLSITRNGEERKVRIRFKNRLASLLTTTLKSMSAQGQSFRKILRSSISAQEARGDLIEQVWGFGPKQASLFLRRVGYCTDLAVLDTHIVDYLRVAKGIDPKPSALSRLSGYEPIEAEFKIVAKGFGYSVGCVDLAMWVTMRVAKREAVW